MSHESLRRRAGSGLLAVLTTAVLGLAAIGPAQAANASLDPANRLGDITLAPASGALSDTTTFGPTTLTTTTGCPVGYRQSSRVLFIWADGSQDATHLAAGVKVAATAGSGLDGNAISRTGTSAARWGSAQFPLDAIKDGLATYVVTCEVGTAPDGATYPAAAVPIGQAKYFSVDVRFDLAAKTWEVVPETVVEKATPTITLTGAIAHADGTVTLTSAVTGDSGAATSGTVELTGTYAGLATPVTGSVPVAADGTASWTSPVLEAGKTYTFAAAYRAGSNAVYTDSTTDAQTTVTTVAEPVPPQSTGVTVTIPAALSGLKFTVTPGDVALGQATLQGTSYVATGALGTVTVSDNRTTRTAWTLNGQVDDFVSTTDATQKIDADYLGWKPALVGSTNGGTAGVEVAAGSTSGLGSARPLAQAAAGATVADTAVQAGITLKAPASSAEGSYTATLLLTLI
ncbi:hypothetical protein [Cellulomonas soli]|nr:hypothetical protein [Cellulomonas soli]NYI60287.1 hypothetical protein [Cellulomonas soli]